MLGECHGHIFMNGTDYLKAKADYETGIHREYIQKDIRSKLSLYKKAGITFFRDGGDHYGASVYARSIAPEYGIDYRTPVFAIHKKGCYGGIVGRGFDSLKEYAGLVKTVKEQKGDFIKVMFSGIMDFSGDGSVTGIPLEKEEIREMIHIAHEEGFSVMAHVNGAKACLHAIESGVDSVEHGNCMNKECLVAMAEHHTVWVPTHVTIRNLLRTERFAHDVIRYLCDAQEENIKQAVSQGVVLAAGSDAGAYAVLHATGIHDEVDALTTMIGEQEQAKRILEDGENTIKTRFFHTYID